VSAGQLTSDAKDGNALVHGVASEVPSRLVLLAVEDDDYNEVTFDGKYKDETRPYDDKDISRRQAILLGA
jgi:hypothetical protein